MLEQIIYQSSCKEIKNGSEFHEAFLYLDGVIGYVENPVLAHATFNYPTRREQYRDTAYLNTLSSLRGVLMGRVSQVLGDKELDNYNIKVNTPTLEANSILDIKSGELMLELLIRDILPRDIAYLRIAIAERAQHALEQYYMSVGQGLRETGKIRETSYYGGHSTIDGVCFQLR